MQIIELLNPAGEVGNRIVGTATFAQENVQGAWRVADVQHQAAPPLESRRLSVLAFRRRFTPTERAAIEWAAVDRADQPDAQRQQAAALRATLADQAAATFIDLEDPDTVDGVQGLESAAILAPGRALEIINAPIQPEEHP